MKSCNFSSGRSFFPFLERTDPKVSVMLGLNEMSPKIKLIVNGGMCAQESLCLVRSFELPHPAFSHPGRLMRLLRPIVRVPLCIVGYIRHQFSVCHSVASQLVRHDCSGLATMIPHKPLEKELSRRAISSSLQMDINHFSILIDSTP